MKIRLKLSQTETILIGILIAILISTLIPTTAIAGKYRTIEAHLQHKTQPWSQVLNSRGYPCGCGATAWTIVFGYWKEYHGKSRLLEGGESALSKHMNEIAKTMGTTYGTFKGEKWGRTMPRKMLKASKYITKRGYKCSINRVRGTEFNKFWKVKKALDHNRPVIILINNPQKPLTSLHYPVIEKAELKQKKVLGKWRNRDVRYFVNMQGSLYKWIWVREVGRNTHKHTGSFSMFFSSIH
ncbi:MAG: hypothetical protein J7L41_07440 [Synergistetes bacterium]|nr:hypothetical protein [Synergistota bacterium]